MWHETRGKAGDKMKKLPLSYWIEAGLLFLFIYEWGEKGFLWWIALMCVGWAVYTIIKPE